MKAIFRDNGYVLNTRPYELNIVGLRSKSTRSNQFDDEIHIFYKKEDGKWNYHIYPATTDPGTFWLNNPAYPQGTAILAQGQYRGAYAIGRHRGLYDALVQVKPVTVIRDYDRDAILDFNNGTRQTGMFGINIHRGESLGVTDVIDKYSAGCQVFQKVLDFNSLMYLCQQHRNCYQNNFTYTLVDFRARRRIGVRRILLASSTVICAGVFFQLIK